MCLDIQLVLTILQGIDKQTYLLLTYPYSLFLHDSKSIGLRVLKFSDSSKIPIALPLGL